MHMTWLMKYSVAVVSASAVAAPCVGCAAGQLTPRSDRTIPAGAAVSPTVASASGARPSAPVPGSGAGGMSKRPEDAGKTHNPDNMPIKRPDSNTNDRILRDHLPSDAIAR